MKSISIPSQRKLYRMYKEARLNEFNNSMAFYNTGNYSRPSHSEMVKKLKQDILSFTSVFEEKIRKEVELDLKIYG